MRVLVAEDNEVALTMIDAILSTAGFQVETARDGAEALARVRTGEVRLVVSDWVMPNMSGLALCRAIRTEKLPAYVYIILLTSNGTLEERVAGLSVGADDFMVKPFNAEELIARVRAGERILSQATPSP